METLPTFGSAPYVQLDRVVHIGTLDVSQKGNRGDSYEGSGLSFSTDPEAWEAIAQLGGQAWWECSLASHRLLDGHALVKQHGDALAQWGIKEGLVTSGTAWVVSWFDDEMDDTMSMWCGSLAQAQEERREEEDPIEERTTYLPTQALRDAMRHKARAGEADPSVLDDLATVWAQRQGLHGVWWKDQLDPDRYSAPRGVLFPEHVNPQEWAPVHSLGAPKPPKPRF